MSQSIAFIDASLAQKGLALKNFSGQIYTIPFGGRRCAVQSARVLKEHKNLDAVHLFSHGTKAALMLGNTLLSPKTLPENAALLQSWQSALAPGADFFDLWLVMWLLEKTGSRVYRRSIPAYWG